MRLICPICRNVLEKDNRTLICDNNHSFDIAKQGYVNLLLKQGGKVHGDSKEMLLARKSIQSKGYYSSISSKIIELVSKYNHENILDIGCGVGYYPHMLKENIDTSIIGIDISKDAIKEASKLNKKNQYIVGSNNEIPLYNDVVDMIINVFSPIYLEEALRVLKPNGHILIVSPNENHLIEMKEVIYSEIIKKQEERNTLIHNQLHVVENVDVVTTITLNQEDIQSLFLMTPHYWTSSVLGKERLASLESLSITLDINLRMYQYISN